MKESITKDWISAKIKIIHAEFRKAVDTGKKHCGVCAAFTFHILCQSLWGSSPAVDSTPNSIDSQDDSSETFESVTLHFPSTITDVIGLLNDYKKSQENADSSNDTPDDEEGNGNPDSQS